MARSLFLGLFGLILLGIGGCTPSGKEAAVSTPAESENRPVTERLCSIIMVGNLSMGNFGAAPPNSSTDSAEQEQQAVLDDLRNPDALDDAQVDKNLKNLIEDKRSEIIPISPELPEDADLPENSTIEVPVKPEPGSIADDPEAIREILSASGDAPLEMKEGAEDVPILDFSNPENVQTLVEADKKANPEEPEPPEVEEITIDLTRPMKHYSDLSDNSDESILQEIDLSGLEDEVLAELQADAAREVEKRRKKPSVADSLREDEEIRQKTPTYTELEAEYQRQAEAFEELFKRVPKEVKKELHKAHFQNFTVWIARVPSGEYYVVRTLEYTGSQCALDYQLLLRSPNYEAWMQEQDRYLRQFSFYDSRDTWLPMKEVWHCD